MSTMRPALLPLTIAAVLPAMHCYGVGTAPALAESPVIEEVLIIGAQAREAQAGSAHVLDAGDLARFAFTDINQTLRQVPGVYLQQEDGFGLRPNIGIRGSGTERSEKISLLEDGVLAAPAPYSNPAAYYFPTTSRMHTIEVLKGPGTVLHGPFTVGGAVNLVSTPIPVGRLGGSIDLSYGGNNEARLLGHLGGSSEQWGWLLETAQLAGDGFQDIDRSSRDADFDVEDYVAKLRWNSPADASVYQQLDLKLQHSEEVSGMSYLGLSEGDFTRDSDRRYGLSALDEMDNSHDSVQLRYRVEPDDDLSLTARVYRNEFERDWFKLNGGGVLIKAANAGDTEAQGILDGGIDALALQLKHNDRSYESEGLQLDAEYAFAIFGMAHSLQTGLRWHEDSMDRYQPVDYYDQLDGQLVYVSTRSPGGSNNRYEDAEAFSAWLLDRLEVGDNIQLTLGGRFEDIDTSRREWTDPERQELAADSKQRRNSLDEFLPAAGFTWQFRESLQLLAGVHKGFAPPGGGSAQGTEGEESWNYEFGLRYQVAASALELIGFYSDYSNTVKHCSLASPCSDGRDAGNESFGEAEIKGVEFLASHDLSSGAALRIPLSLSLTYTDAEISEDSDDGSFLSGDTLPYLPELQWSARIGIEHQGGWQLHLAASYVDDVCVNTRCDRNGIEDSTQRTDDWLVLDLAGHYELNEQTEFYARVDNLLDDRDIVARNPDGARPQKPRTAYVGVRYHF